MNYDLLFSPAKIGNVTVKNRIIMEPMCLGFGQFDGRATDTMMDYYEERAKGGVGLIFTEITRVNDMTGASSFGQLGMSHDYQIDSLRTMAQRVHRHGTKLMVELHHPGRQNLGLMVGTLPICVAGDRFLGSAYAKLLYGSVIPPGKKLQDKDIVPRTVAPSRCEKSKMSESVNRGLSHRGVQRLIMQFIEAAQRVKKAGCDGVELHAAHGYLIQQFLSPNTNRRTDEYGGSLENRMRFLTEIIDGIRITCGRDFPIVVRLSVDEMYDRIGQPGKGYGLEEGLQMAKILSDKRIDAIDVSSACYDTFNYWLEPVTFPCGWRKHLAQAVKEVVNIPVIAANLIRTPEQAEGQLAQGIQDFVGLGRPLIADPYWADKAEQGKANEIRHCINCLYCFESMMEGAYKGEHGHCSVNPFVGRERTMLVQNGNGRKVVIVGAGPAGLTAAELLARRGFDVTVLEKAKTPGGQVLLAAKPPHKERMTWCTEDLTTLAKAAGAEIRTQVEATEEIIAAYDPYAVICATGGSAVHPKAFSGENVCTVTDILTGNVKVKGKQVAVIGSGMTGLETSELLVSQGNHVTIVEMAPRIAPGAYFQHVDDALPKLQAAHTVFMVGQKLLAVHPDSIELENVDTGSKTMVPCDLVVLSLGVRPENGLYESIKSSFSRVYNIGDSNKIGRIHNATEAAYQLAMSL